MARCAARWCTADHWVGLQVVCAAVIAGHSFSQDTHRVPVVGLARDKDIFSGQLGGSEILGRIVRPSSIDIEARHKTEG